MKRVYNALDVAQWFLWYNDYQKNSEIDVNDAYDVYEGITHEKIQELLFFAFSYYFVKKCIQVKME